MSLLFSCQSLSKSFSQKKLFQELSLNVFENDRIGLIGPNGSGKSTLLKILAGKEKADSGILSLRRGLRIGYVPQSCDFPDLTIQEVLLDAVKDNEEMQDYEKEQHVNVWLSKFGFDSPEFSADKLSGGWKKRLSIAKELITAPEVLFLDEPTNHLDLEGILWLEKFLLKEAPAYLLVSHDRYFLQNVTNRIIEMNSSYPKGVFSIDGSYKFFLEKKQEFLEGQLKQEQSLASKARRETEWLRQSPKARTTKSQARIDEAHEIFSQLSDVQTRNTQKKAKLDFISSERETRKLLVAKNIGKQAGDRVLFQGIDFTISPGTRMGLMGPNGSGKTTFLKLLAGELLPDQGTLKRADDLKVVYFDQHRAKLPETMTLKEALSPQGDYVVFQGTHIHVNGWCKRFLFSPDILDMKIGTLSGGERARIAIAHLMLEPADLLLLDEPTNDIDIATLETLEESLMEFPGAVVLITHDRYMLDRICNVFFALGDLANINFYADYAQWEASLKRPIAQMKVKEDKVEEKPLIKAKLSHTEKKEYGQIEAKILGLETTIQELNHELENKEIVQDAKRLAEVCQAIGLAENQMEQLYLRWEELDKKQRG